MRLEKDCIGELFVPDEALYGINSVRAVRNFPISDEKVDAKIIESYLQLKKAAALTNDQAGVISHPKAVAIIAACNQLLVAKDYHEIIVPAIQGGAGTSTNMNINEVLAHLATRLSRQKGGSAVKIHPNDDVNHGQSTNDTYATAGKMAMLKRLEPLLDVLNQLTLTLDQKASQFQNAIKVGRTQLQDAVPTTYGKSFHAYTTLFKRDLKRVAAAAEALHEVNLGGTAVGTGVNAGSFYQHHVVTMLNQVAHLNLTPAADLVDATQNADDYVAFSGSLKTLALDLSKFCNDLRLLSSGPQAGLNELRLPKAQAGSSIMPGKVNPVVPEVVNQVAFEVIGHDVTISMAAEGGQLELNAFEPIIFRDLLKSETYLTKAIETLIENCVAGIEVNLDYCAANVEQSSIAATVLSPYLGYEKTTELIKKARLTHQPVRQLVKQANLLPDAFIDDLFSPAVLTHQRQANNQLLNLTTSSHK